MQLLEQILETYSWYQSVGNQVQETALARYVHHTGHPDIWVANHLSRVRAVRAADIEAVLRRADEVFAHCSHRMSIVDSLTPDAFVARLVLAGFTELTPTLQMVLEGAFEARRSAPSQFELQPVVTDQDWDVLYPLVRANHVEGSSSHHLELDDGVTRRMVAGYRAKASVSQFFLAKLDGVACGYGSSVIGPFGMGIVEDLFTSPEYRRRGIATALIARAVEHARAHGMGPMLIGPHVTEEPKRLYAALGFVPQTVTRQYLLD